MRFSAPRTRAFAAAIVAMTMAAIAGCGERSGATAEGTTSQSAVVSHITSRSPDSLADRLSQSYRVEELAEKRRAVLGKAVDDLARGVASAENKADAAARLVRSMDLALSYKHVAAAAREQRRQMFGALAADRTALLKMPDGLDAKALEEERKALAAALHNERREVAAEEAMVDDARRKLAAVQKRGEESGLRSSSPYSEQQRRSDELLAACADPTRSQDCRSGLGVWQNTAERLAGVLSSLEREKK